MNSLLIWFVNATNMMLREINRHTDGIIPQYHIQGKRIIEGGNVGRFQRVSEVVVIPCSSIYLRDHDYEDFLQWANRSMVYAEG
jgi:hypothetical protein